MVQSILSNSRVSSSSSGSHNLSSRGVRILWVRVGTD